MQENLNSYGHQFQQYQQSEQSPLIPTHRTKKKTKQNKKTKQKTHAHTTYDVGNSCPVFFHQFKCKSILQKTIPS